MYIRELILKNFAGIHATMKTNYLRIDFSKRKNKICLISGPNGKGKTVLLSQLNPFATLGNLDVRDNLPLIIPKKEGYKKIVIIDNENEYNIEHFYTPSKDSHTVKSYVKKNGEELNINGNVTSFKEIISYELELEQDYMKLIRLGNNVVNLISLKSTDRKTFMSKLLDDANIYLSYYKKINADCLSLKTLMNHASDKLKNLPSDDVYTIKEMLETRKEKQTDLEKNLTKLKGDLSVIDYNIREIGDLEDITDRNKSSSKKLEKLYKVLDKKNLSDMTYEQACDEEKNLMKSYQEALSTLERYKERFSTINNSLDEALNNLRSCEAALSKIESESDIESLQNIIYRLKNEVKAEKEKFEKYGEITYTKEDIEKIIVFFKEKQEILNTTYEFGREPIEKVVELMKKGSSVEEYIAYHIAEIEKQEDSIDAKRFARKIVRKYKSIVPKCDKISCKMFQIWDEIESLAESSDSNIDNGREFYTFMNLAYINIKNVILSIADNKELFLKIPKFIQEMVRMDNLYSKIVNTEIIYDYKALTTELSFITDYDNFLKKQEELKEAKEELKNIQTNSSYPYLIDMKMNLDDKISEYIKTCDSLRVRIKEETDKVSYLKENLESMTEIKDTIKNKESIEKEYAETKEKLELVVTYRDNRSKLKSQIDYLEAELQKETNYVRDLEISYNDCKNLTKELKKLKSKYEDFNILKESLSSKDGIPLLFIKLYLQNAKKTINELLDEVYGGSMYVSDFVITANEFNIPFVKDDIEVSDIRYASQGESSFFSIALSFAISYQSMSKYNIMLLDELDSVLDESRRQSFIAIIEKQMEKIEAEQIFAISHNNMFSMYPIDLISVVDKATGYGKLTNVIEIEKEETK